MRSVVVTKFVPWPPNSGEKRRTLGLVRALRAQGPVTLCAFTGDNEDSGPLRDEGIEVRSVPLTRRSVDVGRGLMGTRSLTAARFWDPRLARAVAEAAHDAPDTLMVGHVQLLAYAKGLAARLLVLDMHNIESQLMGRMALTSSGPRRLVFAAEARALRRLESNIADVDVISVVSESDRQTLGEIVRHPRVVVVPNAWDGVEPLPAADRPVVSMVALMSWAPNVDAAVWFSREVWPRVVAAVPEAHLQLVGREPAEKVRRLAGPTITVTGTVADLRPWYADTRVCVAPLLAGGGSRLKILEALAAGRPVVATRIGAEGLEDLVGRGVLADDDPARMASTVIGLLRDPERSAALGRQGAEAVAADHSWAAAVRPLLSALSS